MSNQNSESKPKNTLGTASLIVSIVALAGSWIPVLNIFSMIVAIIGVILGLWSLVSVLIKKSKSFGLPIAAILVGVLSISLATKVNNAALGSDSSSSSSNSSNSSTSSSSSSSSTPKQETKSEYSVGETITSEKAELIVSSVDKNFAGSKYNKPKSGKKFVKVKIKIKNMSNSDLSVNTFNFNIKDSNGAKEDCDSSTYLLDDQFESAELSPNGSREGSLVFEVPENDDNLKLIYDDNLLFSGKEIVVKL